METIAGTSKDFSIQSLNSSSEDIVITNETKKETDHLWKCFCCNLEEYYDFKGTKPPFAKHLTFLEDCYIMKDPFNPPNKGEILVLGADCSICKNSTCMGCSLYYAKRFCKMCALKNIEHFPLKLKNKIILLNEQSDDEM